MGSTISLVFKTIAAGSGLAEINRETGAMQKKLSKLGQGFTTLGSQIGGTFGKISQGLGMLAAGGVWGAVAGIGTAVVGKVVEKWKEHNAEMRKARLAAKGLAEDYGTIERMARQYQKRVERYRKAAEEARKAEAAADKAAADAEALRVKSRKDAMTLEERYYSLEQQIAQEKRKQGLLSADENTQLRTRVKLMLDAAKADVADKERKAAHAEESWKTLGGDAGAVDVARKELELARAKAATTRAEARKLVADAKAAKEAEAAEQEAKLDAMRREDFAREEQQKKREQGEKKIADIRKAAADAVQKIEEKIAAAKKAGEEWGKNAERARGKNFGDWQRGERDLAKEQRTAERKQSNRERNVDAEIEKIAKTSPMARSKWAKDRLRKLRQWKEFQNDANNPGNAVNDLEKQKQAILDKSEKHLAAIENAMKNMGL